MKFNGWVRLWVVVSAVWLLLVGYIAYTDLSQLYGSVKYEVSNPKVGSATFVFSRAQPDTIQQLQPGLVAEITKDPAKYLGRTSTEPYDVYVSSHAKRRITQLSLIAVLPPLVLLLLGWCAGWVWRGFRPTHA